MLSYAAENSRLRTALLEIAEAPIREYEHTYNTGRQETVDFCRPSDTVEIAKAALNVGHDGYEKCSCGQFTHVDEAACVHCGVTKSHGRWA